MASTVHLESMRTRYREKLKYIGHMEKAKFWIKTSPCKLPNFSLFESSRLSHADISVISGPMESKKISNDQELIQSDTTSIPSLSYNFTVVKRLLKNVTLQILNFISVS